MDICPSHENLDKKVTGINNKVESIKADVEHIKEANKSLIENVTNIYMKISRLEEGQIVEYGNGSHLKLQMNEAVGKMLDSDIIRNSIMGRKTKWGKFSDKWLMPTVTLLIIPALLWVGSNIMAKQDNILNNQQRIEQYVKMDSLDGARREEMLRTHSGLLDRIYKELSIHLNKIF
jgi:uncharacterized protein YfkK (UPF0435 family)